MTRRADLRDLLAADGPFASVCFAGGDDLDSRWQAVRDQLTGAREPTLRALDKAISTGAPAAGRFLIAAGESVLLDESLPAAPSHPVARVSALPYIVPLATAGLRLVPHVVVRVGRFGADLRAVDDDGAVVVESSVDDRIAAETARLGQRVGAHLIVLVGEVLPRTMLRRALPPGCAAITAEIAVGRHTDESIVDSEVAELVARRWQAEHDRVLNRFRAGLDRSSGLAVQGLGPTTAALREANVAALVIGDPTMGDRMVWTGSAHRHVALHRDDLDAFGSTERKPERADEALPAAAIASGADVLAGADRVDDGVGALLRHK
jgi:hypothetical protein